MQEQFLGWSQKQLQDEVEYNLWQVEAAVRAYEESLQALLETGCPAFHFLGHTFIETVARVSNKVSEHLRLDIERALRERVQAEENAACLKLYPRLTK